MRVLKVSLVVLLGLAGVVYGVSATRATANEPAAATTVPAAPAAATPAPTAPATSSVVSITPPAATASAPAADAQFPDAFTERALGKADAPVTLIEYSALTCPHCAHFHKDVLPQIKANYIDTGKVRMIFREFAFNQVGIRAAMIARCLPADKYYDFTQALFDTQTTWAEAADSDTLIQQMAGFSGMSFDQYGACVGNQRLLNHILQMRVDATNNFEINSTPTILIQGSLERIVGAQPYATFAEAIDRQLARVGVAAPAPATPPAPAAAHPAH